MAKAENMKIKIKEVELPDGYSMEDWVAIGNSLYLKCIDKTGQKKLLVISRY